MGPSQRKKQRYTPDPRVVEAVERHGAAFVGKLFALDGDTLRRYIDGASTRTTQWWIELHAVRVLEEIAPVKLALVPPADKGAP